MRLDSEPIASDLSQEVDKTITAADQQRAEELQRLKVITEAKASAMERETTRLSVKLGDDHPKVLALTNKIEANRGLLRDLVVEVQRARTDVPSADQKSWLLHGYVRDQDSKGAAGLTVALYDERAVWVERLGFACTNENGYFRLAATDIAGLDRAVFVRVLNRGTFVYADNSELKPALGIVDYREVTLSGGAQVCTPPIASPAPPSNPTPPAKPPDTPPAKPPDVPPAVDPVAPPDAWVVRGRVIDESGKGLEGLTVSVFDKDLIFDDRLGDTKTGADGSFMVTYHAEDFRDVVERKPDIYLKVLDQKGNPLYSSKNAVRYEAGRVEIFEIKIAVGKLKQ